jgi:hypothetical protein
MLKQAQALVVMQLSQALKQLVQRELEPHLRDYKAMKSIEMMSSTQRET